MTLPITNPDMTRFFFTIEEAVKLIYRCLDAPAGVIVSQAMKSVTLGDLAEVMRGDSEIENVGERPGEKHHELLLTEEERQKSAFDDGLFFYSPQGENVLPTVKEYSSETAVRMTQDELRQVLKEYL